MSLATTSDAPLTGHPPARADPNADDSDSQSTTSTSSPVVLYHPPTVLSILRTAAINLVLPFINGLMLGFGELFAHEIAFRLGWSGTRVFPLGRRTMGPGVEIRPNHNNTRSRKQQGRTEAELAAISSVE